MREIEREREAEGRGETKRQRERLAYSVGGSSHNCPRIDFAVEMSICLAVTFCAFISKVVDKFVCGSQYATVVTADAEWEGQKQLS